LRQAQLTLYRNPSAVAEAKKRADFTERDLPKNAVAPPKAGQHAQTAQWAAFTFSGVRPVSNSSRAADSERMDQGLESTDHPQGERRANEKGDAHWLPFMRKHFQDVLFVSLFELLMILYWPLSKLALALRKIKGLNKEIPWPGTRKAERSVHTPGEMTATVPPRSAAGANHPRPDEKDPVETYLKSKIFMVLLIMIIAPAALCLFALLYPPDFSSDFRVLFQVVCGAALVACIVAAAVLYLWLEDKLGLK
jgi:hypothetical protein